MTERRRTRRRSLPFVRSAVLEVDGRTHIVALGDLGPDGAFLTTRLALSTPRSLRLRVVLPRDGREVTLPCELVWHSDRYDAATGRPAGIGVRFQDLDPRVLRRLREFAAEGFLPGPEPVPSEHYEYRILERGDLDVEELNRLGLDGWRLAASAPSQKGVRLVLMRRL